MSRAAFFLVLLGALLGLRLTLAEVGTYLPDMQSWIGWGETVWTQPLARFYALAWSDRLPAILYLLGALAGITRLLPALPPELVYKLPANVADTILSWVIYRLVAARLGERRGLLAGLFYALHPVAWHVAALWGQMEAIQTLLLVGVVALLLRGRSALAAAVLTVAVLVKPHSAVLFLLFPWIIWHGGHTIAGAVRRLTRAAGSALATAWVLTLPFVPPPTDSVSPLTTVAQPFTFLIERSRITAAQYPYASVNALNLWTVLGQNWQPDSTTFLGVTLSTWGAGIFLVTAGLLLRQVFRENPRADGRAWGVAAALLLFAFTFLTRAHERHLAPVFAFLLLGTGFRTHDHLLFGFLTAAALTNTVAAFRTLDAGGQILLPAPFESLVGLVPVLASVLLIARWFRSRAGSGPATGLRAPESTV